MWGKIMVLYYMKRIGFLWHLSDVSHPVKSYNTEQLWKIGMKTSELKKKEKDRYSSSMLLAKKKKKSASHGFFSYIPVSKITLKDIYCSTLCILMVRKKVTLLKITPHEKKKIIKDWRKVKKVGGGP